MEDWQDKFNAQFERVETTVPANGHDKRRAIGNFDTELRVMTLSSVKAEKLIPLWPGRLWRGKTSLMAGDPGLGKSLLTLDIAARITTGREWPASIDRSPLGDVILLSAEDDAADTLRPRLEAAGADLSRVHALTEVIERDPKTGQPRRKSFRLGTHLADLERICAERKPLLLVIDPITAYMSADTDSHATADVRSDLAPLAEMAQAHGIAVLMVSHLNKATTMQAIYRVTGSVAFVAAARSAFGVVRDPADRERRYLLPLKNNLGKDIGGLVYRIAFNGQAPYLAWESEPVDVDINTIATTPRERAKQAVENEVSVWLRDELRDGPVAATTLWRRAKEAGYSERKVKVAIRNLGIEGAPAGFRGAWHYALTAESSSDSDSASGHIKASDSGRVCEFPEKSSESDTAQVSECARFSGNIQTPTQSDTFTTPETACDSGAKAF